MAKRVFFSFHYQDVETFRANVVRNHHVTKESGTAGFFDASIWEDAETHGPESVKRLIHGGLVNTSATCVLIGTDTWKRRWVRYEIMKSYDRGNVLLGVHINKIPDRNRQTFANGKNIFNHLGFYISKDGATQTYFERGDGDWAKYEDLPPKRLNDMAPKWWGRGYTLSAWVKTYCWTENDGYNNFAGWVEEAT